MRTLKTVLTLTVLLATIPALAGPLVKSNVSAEANWLVHIDADQLVSSKIGQLIRAELAKEGLEQKLLDFKQIFSFHPIDDIRNATLYGNGDDREKAVILVEGNFEKETLISLVRMNPEYQEISHGDLVVHSWVHENKKDPNKPGERMFGCIPKENVVVMGAGLEMVKQAVDVLKGLAANAADGVFKQDILNREGAFFQIAANALGDIAAGQKDAALFNQTDELGGVIGEDDGKFYVNLSLKAQSEEIAQNLKKMLDGMIAFFTLAGAEKPALAELAKKLSLSCVDRTITLYFQADPEEIVSFLKEQAEAKKQ